VSNIQSRPQDWVTADADLRVLVDACPDGVCVAEPDGRLTFVNRATCRLLGYSREELVGKSLAELRDEAERTGAPPHAEGELQDWRLRRKDGTWVEVEANVALRPDGRWQASLRDVSARKAREAVRDTRLAESEADRRWLQTVLETVPLGVLLFRHDGPLSCNRRAEELLGMTLSPSGGSAQYSSRIRFPDGRPVPPGELVSQRVLQRGETIVGEEYIIEGADGARIRVLGSAAPIRDAAGAVLGGVGVFQDVSDRMRMDEEIRMNERLLHAIFDIIPVGIWVADETGRIVRTNPAGEQIWKGARYVGVPQFGQYKGWWLDSGKPIAAEEWALARALTKGETSTGELLRIQCFDGSFKTIINSAMPLRDERGAIVGAIVVNEDITELHEAQEKHREGERLLRTVFDLLPVGLWVADRHGRITLANPAGLKIWAGTQFVGPDRFGEYKAWWVDTGAPIAPEEWGLARAIRPGETARAQLIRIQCFDGSLRTVINWAAPIRSDTGEIVGAVAVNEDVTPLQHTQEQLRVAVRDREAILATVAHDLRNPLQAILAYVAAADHEAATLPGGETMRQLTRSVAEISRRMSGLVDDLLTVAVKSTGGPSMLKLGPVSAASLLAKAAAGVRPLVARAGLELSVEIASGLPVLNVDADRVLRVLGNLLDNALKFTRPPGHITLAAEWTAGGVLLSVANSGEPLTREEREAMFRPFWQRKQDRRGAGLGLSICRSIIEAHGGTIWVEPLEGHRVRICFVLPTQAAALPP
jgi:PAS domain S-box-containing protein